MKFIEATREDGAHLLINVEHIRMAIEIGDYTDVLFVGCGEFETTRIRIPFNELENILDKKII